MLAVLSFLLRKGFSRGRVLSDKIPLFNKRHDFANLVFVGSGIDKDFCCLPIERSFL
jgi:hypothetical protein